MACRRRQMSSTRYAKNSWKLFVKMKANETGNWRDGTVKSLQTPCQTDAQPGHDVITQTELQLEDTECQTLITGCGLDDQTQTDACGLEHVHFFPVTEKERFPTDGRSGRIAN